MDFLSDDLLISIAKRIASHSVRDLLSFMRTNKRHATICRLPEISLVFGDDCTRLLTDLRMTHAKLDFIDHLLKHGNALFCILRCTQHMLHSTPDFEEIERLLGNAAAAGSWTAKYFQVLMDATFVQPLDEYVLLEKYRVLVETHNVRRYRREIKGIGTSFMFRSTWYKRPLPPSMFRRRFCQRTCRCWGDGRMANGDYDITHYCIHCRLDEEVRWFLEEFSFNFNYGLLF